MTADRPRRSYAVEALKPYGRVLYSTEPRATYYLNCYEVLFRVRDAILLHDERFQWVRIGDARATVRVFRQAESMPIYHRFAAGASRELSAERCFAQIQDTKTRYREGRHGGPAGPMTPPSLERERADRTNR